MQNFLIALTFASLIIFIVGVFDPGAFKKWLGTKATRLPIIGFSVALFFGTSMAMGVLYPQTPTVEEPELITPAPEEPQPEPTFPKETPNEDEEGSTATTVPKNNDTNRSPSLVTPEPIQPEPESEPELTPAPAPAQTPAPVTVTTAPSTPTYDCSYDKYNCGDFNNCTEVMSVFNYCGPRDINGLDGNDNDGVPCESLCE